uniref:Putative nonfluorescent protein n=1 Tax=Ocyropsis maculata TaxID=140483 RepID=A0A1C8YXP4_9METZ|nr:putative nonfluorescent protein [Ocyropsis maculata]
MDHRMERAESMFTGTSKSKVIADIHFGDDPDMTFKVTGEGFAQPLEGSQSLELNCSTPLPINFNVVGTIIQTNFRMFTQYTGSMVYDFFKTSFPGQMNVEMDGTFTDELTVKVSCTLTYVKDCLICRCQVHFENLTGECPAASEDMSATLPCFEILDKGEKADECRSSVDLVWRTGHTAEKYSCRLNSVIKCAGNFAPSFHFIGHDFKLTEKSENNRHFTQRQKSRATIINYYKNSN